MYSYISLTRQGQRQAATRFYQFFSVCVCVCVCVCGGGRYIMLSYCDSAERTGFNQQIYLNAAVDHVFGSHVSCLHLSYILPAPLRCRIISSLRSAFTIVTSSEWTEQTDAVCDVREEETHLERILLGMKRSAMLMRQSVPF